MRRLILLTLLVTPIHYVLAKEEIRKGVRYNSGSIVEMQSTVDVVSDPSMKVSKPEEASTTEGLRQYTVTLLRAHKNMSEVKITDEQLSVKSREPAKLFGFIPVSYDAAISVGKDDVIHVDVPWWVRFVSGGRTFSEYKTQHLSTLLNEDDMATSTVDKPVRRAHELDALSKLVERQEARKR